MVPVSNQIRAWRKRRKLSQSAAAAALGIPVATLENWEQARYRPRGLALAALLGRIA